MFNITKKSFTLVELSIVLLVLSILFGILLTGRKIVVRANVQRAISEIDYYTKALVMFTDAYNVLPGNMDEEICMKYSEFSQVGTENNGIEVGDHCRSDRATFQNGKTNDGFASSTLMATSERWTSYLNAMRFMQTSGVINEVNTTIADDELASGQYSDSDKGPLDKDCMDCISYENVKRTQAVTSFDGKGAVTLAGIVIDTENTNSLNLNFIRGSNNVNGDAEGHEFYNPEIQKIVNSQNVLIMYRNTPASADSEYGAGALSTGILSADIANQLDVKLDDGKPGSGKLIGLKNGYVKKSGIKEDDIKRICYNTLQKDVSSAYYVSNTETKNGCNILYVIK